jgi:hypothetical protein
VKVGRLRRKQANFVSFESDGVLQMGMPMVTHLVDVAAVASRIPDG